MCCEECSNYEVCVENNRLRDDCCPKCPEYYDCVGADDREEEPFRDSFRDKDIEDYF